MRSSARGQLSGTSTGGRPRPAALFGRLAGDALQPFAPLFAVAGVGPRDAARHHDRHARRRAQLRQFCTVNSSLSDFVSPA